MKTLGRLRDKTLHGMIPSRGTFADRLAQLFPPRWIALSNQAATMGDVPINDVANSQPKGARRRLGRLQYTRSPIGKRRYPTPLKTDIIAQYIPARPTSDGNPAEIIEDKPRSCRKITAFKTQAFHHLPPITYSTMIDFGPRALQLLANSCNALRTSSAIAVSGIAEQSAPSHTAHRRPVSTPSIPSSCSSPFCPHRTGIMLVFPQRRPAGGVGCGGRNAPTP